jgi:transcription initiation factor IIE alpha subunit
MTKGFICFHCKKEGMTYSEAKEHAQSCPERKLRSKNGKI